MAGNKGLNLLLVVVAMIGISGITAEAQNQPTYRPDVVRVTDERLQNASDAVEFLLSDKPSASTPESNENSTDTPSAGAPASNVHSANEPSSQAPAAEARTLMEPVSETRTLMELVSEPLPSDALRLTLDETIGMALQKNAGIRLAGANVRVKKFATDIARSDYFPKVSGTAGVFHFNEALGETLQLRRFGPVPVNIIDQDSSYAGVTVGQPITQLLTIKQAVHLAEADKRIAQAQLQGGRRDLAFGVTQLFFGLLAAQQGQAAAELQQGVAQASKDKTAGRIATLQAQQAVMQAAGQVTELEQQLNNILCLPLDTHFDLVEPPLPEPIDTDVEDAVFQAIRCSPEVREARQGIAQACAGLKIAKLSYVPAVAAVGGYFNQHAVNIFDEENIAFIGVTASTPFLDGGKRRATLQERKTQVAMARHNLRMVEQKTRLAVRKVYQDYEGAWQALQMAYEILQIRKDAAQQAGSKASPEITAAEKAAQIEVMKAEVNYRLAHAQMMSVIDGQGAPSPPKSS